MFVGLIKVKLHWKITYAIHAEVEVTVQFKLCVTLLSYSTRSSPLQKGNNGMAHVFHDAIHVCVCVHLNAEIHVNESMLLELCIIIF